MKTCMRMTHIHFKIVVKEEMGSEIFTLFSQTFKIYEAKMAKCELLNSVILLFLIWGL